ncbi:metal-dependent hydrolase [Halorubrum laminariae]|uniref:Metal-dependent hydrolase n=1 Tax=Halorubrum laminariae TaxID=1433523 RepID=A0ABD6C0T6_9EURY|nr:metal-dependent hydrolase [Halorubrum laminariae]
MLPWGHAAFGYLLYSLYTRQRLGRPPIGLSVFAVGFGTQFPDLIDKPLTWTVPLLPYGRSLAHSLFTVTVLCAVLWIIVEHRDQRALVIAFAVGYLSHLVGDMIGPLVSRDFLALGYLFWPVTAVPEGGTQSFLTFFLTLEMTPLMVFEIVLTVLGAGVWMYDGLPGIKDLYEEQIDS